MSVKFIADAMLGSLARWLRLIGLDTLYSPSYTDKDILTIAERENRVILTRDKVLAKKASKKGLQVVLLSMTILEEALAYLAFKFDFSLDFDPERTRCPLCNSRLRIVENPLEIRVTWQPPVLARSYWVCPQCGQVYWKGRHFKAINSILRKAKNALKFKETHK